MAPLWHRWCSTLCSKRTLPNALLGPRPLDQRRITNEIQYQSQGATNQVQVAWPVHSIITNAALLPSRPPLPNIWDSSQESLGSLPTDQRLSPLVHSSVRPPRVSTAILCTQHNKHLFQKGRQHMKRTDVFSINILQALPALPCPAVQCFKCKCHALDKYDITSEEIHFLL